MSFLGSIGHIMEVSGLEYLLGQVYADSTVKHVISGKAYARAMRGHLLVTSALHTIMTSMALNTPLPPVHTEGTESSDIFDTETLLDCEVPEMPTGTIAAEQSDDKQFPHSAFTRGPRSPALEEGMRAAMGATRERCAGPYA